MSVYLYPTGGEMFGPPRECAQTLDARLTDATAAAWRAARAGIGEGFREFMDGLARDVKGAAPRSISTVMAQYPSEEMQNAGVTAAGLRPVR